LALTQSSSFDDNDEVAATDFLNLVMLNKPLTKKQGIYLCKIMLKYKDRVQDTLDIENKIKECTWKNEFRVLDQERKISLEKKDEIYWIHFKFPYSFKTTFDTIFKDNDTVIWDNEIKTNKIQLYECNLLKVLEFAREHQFAVDDQLIIVEALCDEIEEQRSMIEFYSSMSNGSIQLNNCSSETLEYFNNRRSGKFYEDLLLSKKMGLQYKGELSTPLLEKIFKSQQNNFNISLENLVEFYQTFQQDIYITINKSKNYISWTKEFVDQLEQHGISKSQIKICFREKNSENKEFNQWIKDNKLGGPIDNENIFLFLGSPAKWIFKNKKDLSVFVTNSDYFERFGSTDAYLRSSALSFILEGKQ
jgi:hypothetical protein